MKKNDDLKIIYKEVGELIPYVNNPRNNTNAVDAVASSIKNFGFKNPIVIDDGNEIINGHTRMLAAKKLGLTKVPCILADDLSDEEKKAFRLADNKTSELAEWDFDLLNSELEELTEMNLDFDMSDFGFEDDIDATNSYLDEFNKNYSDTHLSSTFIVPPFSVIDTKNKEWQDRKNTWLNMGIKSEIGREKNLLFSENLNDGSLGNPNNGFSKGTSIFDPALCEVLYRWFIPENGFIVDPFAGGSVRGIVANKLGYSYLGIDLREEQIEANYNNAKELDCNLDNLNWKVDDSQNIDKYLNNGECDILFTCPPYYDLERYSDNEKDISNMEYEDFIKTYSNILMKTGEKVKDNRFAIVVISDVRDEKGFYRDLTGITKTALAKVGFKFYNDIILLNAIGTACIRARRNMNNRKVTRIHQNVLVFYKGDTSKIKSNFKLLQNYEEYFSELEEEKLEI